MEFLVPIELKYKTRKQSAEDVGAMDVYKDLYRLEQIKSGKYKDKKEIPFSYFFFITDDHLYVNKPRSGLRTIFKTYDGATIQKDYEYKYLQSKTGKDYFKKNGEFVFKSNYKFSWSKSKNNSRWFLKLKI